MEQMTEDKFVESEESSMKWKKDIRAFIDVQSLLLAGEKRFHSLDFTGLCRELRQKHGVRTFYLIGNLHSRLTRLVLDDIQMHELQHEGIEVEPSDWYEDRTYSHTVLASELARAAFTPESKLDGCIVVTANTAVLPMLVFLRTSGVSVELLLPQTHPNYEEIRVHVPLIEDIDITLDGLHIIDKICLKEIHDILLWSDERSTAPMRITIVRQLQRYSKIQPSQTTFFLNALVYHGILREEKHEGEGQDGETFFTVHIADESAFQQLLAA